MPDTDIQQALRAVQQVQADFLKEKEAIEHEYQVKQQAIAKKPAHEQQAFRQVAEAYRRQRLNTARRKRDEDLKRAKENLDNIIARRRAELAPARHTARLAVAPEGAAKADVMRLWLDRVRSVDDLIGLHADAVEAGDHEAAWFLETHGTQALARALGLGDDWQHDPSATQRILPWQQAVERSQRQRGAEAWQEVDAAESELAGAEDRARAYMTTDERREFAAVYGVQEQLVPDEPATAPAPAVE